MKTNIMVHLLPTLPQVRGVGEDCRMVVVGRVTSGVKQAKDRQVGIVMDVGEAVERALDILYHVPVSAFESGKLDAQVVRLRKLLRVIGERPEQAPKTPACDKRLVNTEAGEGDRCVLPVGHDFTCHGS